jgi:hypothetical protein
VAGFTSGVCQIERSDPTRAKAGMFDLDSHFRHDRLTHFVSFVTAARVSFPIRDYTGPSSGSCATGVPREEEGPLIGLL